jgi:CheY-like chemotaxis protein
MSEPKQILAVDEQKATLDFLHSVLPLIEGEGVEIRRALSAEEGLLELRRRPFDLLIAGLRLPGMDGLEMARQARRLRPDMPIILASARPLPELRDEAAALGVSHFLRKPLDAEEFLSAVQESFASASPIPPPAGTDLPQTLPAALPDAIAERLETLCIETGAGQVLLVTVAGEVLHTAGRQLHPDIARLVAATAASVSCSLYLSEQLDDREPQAVQFLEGDGCDLYWANVGHDHFIVILFDAQIRRGRIGTVWVFAQRAVAELRTLLAGPAGDPGLAQPKAEQTPTKEQTIVVDPPIQETQSPPDAEEAPDDDAMPHGESAEAAQAVPDAAEAVPESSAPADHGDPAQRVNLDAYWDDAMASDTGDDFFTSGISLEEAKKKGLVAEDFNPDDQ